MFKLFEKNHKSVQKGSNLLEKFQISLKKFKIS